MKAKVEYDVTDGVAVISISNPPVNALSDEVRHGLFDAFERADADDHVGAIVLSAKGRTFPAGADAREFGRPRAAPTLADVCARIEACQKPVLAAIHGHALGSGFELALACHYRIALQDATLGLPEVNLGVLPGGGGTQRLPRITGANAALDLMITGKPITAQRGGDLGLIDKVIQKNLDRAARLSAGNMIAQNSPPRPTCSRDDGLSNPGAYTQAVNSWRTRVKGNFVPSVRAIVDCVEAALLLPFDAGIALERKCFDDCETGDEATALRHAFFAERRTAKLPELEGATPRSISSIGIMGAGGMGADIATACLDAGLLVIIVDSDDDGLARGGQRIKDIYEKSVSKGRMGQAAAADRLSRLRGTTDVTSLSKVDLVIETMSEDAAVKHDVFAQLDKIMRPGAILATNTSHLDIDALAAATSRPQDVVGYHFFAPAHITKLIEVVVGDQTHRDVAATGFALAAMLGKVAVRAGASDGFIGNRVLAAYRQAADFMLEDGANPAQIDGAMRAYGFALGPYQVLDMTGLDTAWKRGKHYQATCDREERYVAIRDRMCDEGWLGQKTGRGYYVHGHALGPVENDDALGIIEDERRRKSIIPRPFTDDDIRARCLNAMANEGARLLDEGVAWRPSDIDVVMMYGYGFPRFRGGPMMSADQRGLLAVRNALKSYQPDAPDFWTPSRLFDELIKNGRHFSDLNGG
ncbi:3-hydroxyacyl-CoA dehydrogenase NAD-binding domain-containing protein [uncultured Aliiroseovarius sp.]|uniref:3-hydroxyacyl-CoA dehydrogenase NAD-binding domain-containing protein n=1 Tax=uncultured Aliiroseovarius sp. TaxID=1658783 RepID=UPI002596CB07|nr:3-hydroxyacyl-CoA dehydrogenase NAD-binding domain-containing protein [uncultured Aliiroseovarius sp.]